MQACLFVFLGFFVFTGQDRARRGNYAHSACVCMCVCARACVCLCVCVHARALVCSCLRVRTHVVFQCTSM